MQLFKMSEKCNFSAYCHFFQGKPILMEFLNIKVKIFNHQHWLYHIVINRWNATIADDHSSDSVWETARMSAMLDFSSTILCQTWSSVHGHISSHLKPKYCHRGKENLFTVWNVFLTRTVFLRTGFRKKFFCPASWGPLF